MKHRHLPALLTDLALRRYEKASKVKRIIRAGLSKLVGVMGERGSPMNRCVKCKVSARFSEYSLWFIHGIEATSLVVTFTFALKCGGLIAGVDFPNFKPSPSKNTPWLSKGLHKGRFSVALCGESI